MGERKRKGTQNFSSHVHSIKHKNFRYIETHAHYICIHGVGYHPLYQFYSPLPFLLQFIQISFLVKSLHRSAQIFKKIIYSSVLILHFQTNWKTCEKCFYMIFKKAKRFKKQLLKGLLDKSGKLSRELQFFGEESKKISCNSNNVSFGNPLMFFKETHDHV